MISDFQKYKELKDEAFQEATEIISTTCKHLGYSDDMVTHLIQTITNTLYEIKKASLKD